MKWIRLIDEAPEIPKEKYGVPVLVASFDPCYDEINPGRGYSVKEANFMLGPDWPVALFYELMTDGIWIVCCDEVTHWMYFPSAPEYDPEVLNPIFKRFHENSRPQGELKQI